MPMIFFIHIENWFIVIHWVIVIILVYFEMRFVIITDEMEINLLKSSIFVYLHTVLIVG